MRHLTGLAALLVLALVVGTTAVVSGAAEPAKHYVCVPCALPCDSKVFDHPGTCPDCGMALVEQGSAAAKPSAPAGPKVGILVFNGVEIIDYTGPWEVFGAAGFDVYTVAASRDPITTAMGMTVVPKYTFADAPQPDILVVPGGGVKGASSDAPTLAWVRASTEHVQHTMSVCNGAFILASAGLLDGLHATTTAGNLDRLKDGFPKIQVVYDQRVVDNGKIITAGGLSAGIDGALHVVEKLKGRGTAEQVALGEEYDWQAQSRFARAALADHVIPAIRDGDLEEAGDWHPLRTEGDRDQWDVAFEGPSKLSARELFTKVGDLLASRGKCKWTRSDTQAAESSAPLAGEWKIVDTDGRQWKGTVSVTVQSESEKRYLLEIRVARAG